MLLNVKSEVGRKWSSLPEGACMGMRRGISLASHKRTADRISFLVIDHHANRGHELCPTPWCIKPYHALGLRRTLNCM